MIWERAREIAGWWRPTGPVRLSERDKRHFVTRGYVVKRLRVEPAELARAIDLVWATLGTQVDRNDPASWRGKIRDCCETRDLAERRGRIKLKEAVERDPTLIGLIQTNPDVLAMVRQLIGPTARPRAQIRGLYPIFPLPRGLRRTGGMDAHPFQICAILYLSDVERGAGDFTVWPGSHRIMRFAFPGHASWRMLPVHEELKAEVHATAAQVSLPGPAGTLILWHHRLLHTPSINRGTEVRHALLADFHQDGWEDRRDEPHHDDMWTGWAVGERPTGSSRSGRVAPISRVG